MSEQLFVSSRKGLFIFYKNGSTWTSTQKHFLGEPVTALAHHRPTNTLLAALNLGHFGVKLHRSNDAGKTWREVSVPSYRGVNDNDIRNQSLTNQDLTNGDDRHNLELIWVMEYDGNDVLWAGTLPGGLFKSTDHGDNWELIHALWNEPLRKEWFGGGYDIPGIHSICFDPRDPNDIVVAVSCGGVWRSKDGGNQWKVCTHGMKADYMPPEQAENPATQDPHRLVQNPSQPNELWVQHHNGIFLSRDRGENWQEVQAKPSSFGFAVATHPTKPGCAWFVPAQKDEKRYPVDFSFAINKTEDYGENFATITDGLPEGESFDLVYRHALDVNTTGTCLAMGSTTGNLWVSEDSGNHWKTISNHLPPIYAVKFSAE